MRHKALVRAILQVTGYRKSHIKHAGNVLPRVNGEFTRAFKQIVEHFLEKLGCGSMFFPEIVPDYEGWDISWLAGERYKWVHGRPRGEPTEQGEGPTPSDKDRIREAVMLMFENLRDHDNTLDLDDSITLEVVSQMTAARSAVERRLPMTRLPFARIAMLDAIKLLQALGCTEEVISCATTRESKKRTGDFDRTPTCGKKLASSPIIDEARFGSIVGTPLQTRSTRRNCTGGYQMLSGSRLGNTPSPSTKRRVSAGNYQRRTSRSTPGRDSLLPAFGSSALDFQPFGPIAMARSSKDNIQASGAISRISATAVQSMKDKAPAAVDRNQLSSPFQPRSWTPAASDTQPDVPSTFDDISTGSSLFVSPVLPESAKFNELRASTSMDQEPSAVMSNPSEQTKRIMRRSSATIENTDIRNLTSSTEQTEITATRTSANNKTEILRGVHSAQQTPATITTAFNNIQILSQEQINRTKLRIRLGAKSLIYRSVELSHINPLDGIFAACVNRWEDRLKGQAPRIVAYLPRNLEGVTEFTANSEASEFLRLMKAEWNRGVEDKLTVVMVLLRDDEEF
ncbi:hypothetical protein DL95DRAFT_466678 [Leptodontidium sp. 2 PMI_412]|nr:hypothetical protein DL95DRAFT_466678 [Leptodontidium sp. 2 PMI_412]